MSSLRRINGLPPFPRRRRQVCLPLEFRDGTLMATLHMTLVQPTLRSIKDGPSSRSLSLSLSALGHHPQPPRLMVGAFKPAFGGDCCFQFFFSLLAVRVVCPPVWLVTPPRNSQGIHQATRQAESIAFGRRQVMAGTGQISWCKKPVARSHP